MLLDAAELDGYGPDGVSVIMLEVKLGAVVVEADICRELTEASELGISELESSWVLVNAVELYDKSVVEKMLEVEAWTELVSADACWVVLSEIELLKLLMTEVGGLGPTWLVVA